MVLNLSLSQLFFFHWLQQTAFNEAAQHWQPSQMPLRRSLHPNFKPSTSYEGKRKRRLRQHRPPDCTWATFFVCLKGFSQKHQQNMGSSWLKAGEFPGPGISGVMSWGFDTKRDATHAPAAVVGCKSTHPHQMGVEPKIMGKSPKSSICS